MSWYCEICDKTLKQANKNRHVNSKGHIEKINKPECSICIRPITLKKTCNKCNQCWCGKCDTKINKCPYCRTSILGRENRAAEQERLISNWYASSEAFTPSQTRPTAIPHFMQTLQDPLEFLEEIITELLMVGIHA
jgi:hypothetical protein